MDVEHGTNLGNARSVQSGHRLEAADPSLKEQRHDEGLHSVVIVMPQSQLVEPLLQKGLIQCPPAHFRAQGAGILFLPVVENNGGDLRFDHGIGHFQPVAHFLHPGVVHPQSHVNGDPLQLEGLAMVFPQSGKQGQQHQGILSPGHADRDFVPGFNHIIVVHTPANQTHQLLHSDILS